MNHPQHPTSSARRGASLVEAVIAVGVLAISIPLVFGTFVQSGRTSASAEAETRCGWIVPACLAEIDASRRGRPAYFTATLPGEEFPAAGDVWALGFGPDGQVVDRIARSDYDKGLSRKDGEPVRFIATLAAEEETAIPQSDSPAMLRTTITVEYPSAAPAEKRDRITFHTRIP